MTPTDRQETTYAIVEAFHDQERGAISFNEFVDKILELIEHQGSGVA